RPKIKYKIKPKIGMKNKTINHAHVELAFLRSKKIIVNANIMFTIIVALNKKAVISNGSASFAPCISNYNMVPRLTIRQTLPPNQLQCLSMLLIRPKNELMSLIYPFPLSLLVVFVYVSLMQDVELKIPHLPN